MEKVPKQWGNNCSCQDTNLSPADWSLLFPDLQHTTSIATNFSVALGGKNNIHKNAPSLWLKTENTQTFLKTTLFLKVFSDLYLGVDSSEAATVVNKVLYAAVACLRAIWFQYKDIYLSVTFKCTQEFVLVTSHSYEVLTNRQNVTISHV